MFEYLYNHPGIVMGVLIAGVGVAVWLYPQLMSGYYQVSPENRDRIDWRGLRRYLSIGFVVLGALLTTLDLVIRNDGVSHAVRLSVAFIGVIGLIGTAHRFDRNKR